MKDREQTGIFFLSSDKSLEEVSHEFGYSVLKKILGLRWEIHISHMLQAGSQRYKLTKSGNTSIVSIIKKIRDKIVNDRNDNSKVILLPSNNPAKAAPPGVRGHFDLPPIQD